ncbi:MULTISPECIES: DUF3298 domain-containing protein [Vibrio]|nr:MULTISPECIES: DUF3298 domain-containing protein [Vibrio]
MTIMDSPPFFERSIMKHRVFTAMFFLISAPSLATSFDCGKARTAIEKMLCADEELSREDSRLGYLYQEIRNNTPRLYFLKEELTSQQRLWLKQRDKACDKLLGVELTHCLATFYETRYEQLRQLRDQPASVQSTSKWYDIETKAFLSFDQQSRICHDEMFLEREPMDSLLGFHLETLESISPLKAPKVEDRVEGCPESTSSEHRYSETLVYVNNNVVSLQVYHWAYSGGAHGNGEPTLLSIDTNKRALLSWQDIFGDNQALEQHIYRRVASELLDEGYLPAPSVSGAIFYFKETGAFTIRSDGLYIQYPAYAIAPYSNGEPSLTIPLLILQKYMTKDQYQYFFGAPTDRKLALRPSLAIETGVLEVK